MTLVGWNMNNVDEHELLLGLFIYAHSGDITRLDKNSCVYFCIFIYLRPSLVSTTTPAAAAATNTT